VVIKQNQYKDDARPLDEACRCYTCRTFSRAYLRHLFQASEILFSTLATIHNLAYYLGIMRGIRQAILRGAFPDFLQSVPRESRPS
jgi:queuine tRNA-ribosyltransferase